MNHKIIGLSKINLMRLFQQITKKPQEAQNLVVNAIQNHPSEAEQIIYVTITALYSSSPDVIHKAILDTLYEAILADITKLTDIVRGAIKADPYLSTEIIEHATATSLAINPDEPKFLDIITAAHEAFRDKNNITFVEED